MYLTPNTSSVSPGVQRRERWCSCGNVFETACRCSMQSSGWMQYEKCVSWSHRRAEGKTKKPLKTSVEPLESTTAISTFRKRIRDSTIAGLEERMLTRRGRMEAEASRSLHRLAGFVRVMTTCLRMKVSMNREIELESTSRRR